MSYSRDEIEELKKQDLRIAKVVSFELCIIQYNMNLRFFTGEELNSYTELFSKKLDAAIEEIKNSQTAERALDIGVKFRQELLKYIKATKVATADKAMEIAHSFIKKYSPVALPLKAERQDDVWLVDIDVGALAVKIAKVKVDARTGDILSYEIPPK